MPDELDDRIRDALNAEIAELALTITPSMIEGRLEQRPHPSWFTVVVGTATVGALLAGLLVALGILPEPRNVGPPMPPAPTASPAGDPSRLVWEEIPMEGGERVVFTGDRFVLFGSGESRMSSVNGLDWTEIAGESIEAGAGSATWDGAVVAWSDSLLQLQRPDGSSIARMFDAPISAATIGPAGIVVLGRSAVNETMIIEEVLGREWGDRLSETCMCAPGTLTVTRDDGRTADIVLADHGYEGMRDPRWRGGWFSTTGNAWHPIPEPLGGERGLDPRRVVGVASGFVALSDDALWHSSDGLTWQVVDEMAADDIVTWRGGVVAVDYQSSRYLYWSLDGGAEEISPELSTGVRAFVEPVTAAGPVGIVTVDRAADRLLYSSGGRTWSVSALPASREWSSGFAAWGQTSVAVGRNAVVMLLWEWGPDGREVPSLWRGTVAE